MTRHMMQAFVKQHLEDAAVSQRDLQRVFNLLAFFIQHHHSRRRDLPETVPQSPDALVHRSLLPCYDMDAVVQYELDLYISAAELPPGIAPNQALKENFFCIAVCVETKTPLIIIGTPGVHSCPVKVQHTCLSCMFALRSDHFVIHIHYSIDVVETLAVQDILHLLQIVQQQRLNCTVACAVNNIAESQHQTCKNICFACGFFCCCLAAQERYQLPRDDTVSCNLQGTARH